MSESSVRIHYHRHELYDKLVKEWDLFDSYVDLFVFAASVGYATSDNTQVLDYPDEEYRGSGDERGEMLWMHLSGNSTYRAVAASLAYELFEDAEALANPSLQLEALARFAYAGMDTLEQEFGDSVSTPRDGMLAFIAEFENPDEAMTNQGDIMDRISSSFGEDVADN